MAVTARLAGAVSAAAPAGATTPTTNAGSIVFIKNDNVWLTSPDGAVQRQVTTDGTADAPYLHPSQSDDGNVIVAIKNINDGGPDSHNLTYKQGHVFVFNRQGQQIRTFAPPQPARSWDPPACLANLPFREPYGISGAAVSPDGTTVAYEVFYKLIMMAALPNGGFGCQIIDNKKLGMVDIVGTGAREVTDSADSAFNLGDPSWIGSTRLLLTGQVGAFHPIIITSDLAGNAVKWFDASATDQFGTPIYGYNYDPSLRGTKLATDGYDYTASGVLALALWSTTGPPAIPTLRCQYDGPSPGGGPTATTLAANSNETWAPDGSALAWHERQTDVNGNVVADGIFAMAVGDIASTCPSPDERHLLISGATEPLWGPAPVGPSAPRRPPADFNGDGRTDVAVFRPSTGAWYVQGQSGALWGTNGDIPLPLPSAIRMVFFP